MYGPSFLNTSPKIPPRQVAKHSSHFQLTFDPHQHTQRMLQRSISSDDRQKGESTRKAQDMAAIREVYKKRQSKSQKPQKPEKPRKVKSEKAERRRRTMSVVGPGSATDPVVIDD